MRRWVRAIAVCSLAACAAMAEDPGARRADDPPAPLAPLSGPERERATALAAKAITARALAAEGRLVLVAIEPFRLKDDPSERLALVTHYGYAGDLTIATLVDLAAGRVVDVSSRTGASPPLAKAELDQARELALADPRVAAAIPEHEGVEVQGLLLRAASPDDRYWGKRVVRLLFKRGDHYLSEPVVEVDLTSQRVFVEERRGPPAPLSHH